jgi:hypothetical protein
MIVSVYARFKEQNRTTKFLALLPLMAFASYFFLKKSPIDEIFSNGKYLQAECKIFDKNKNLIKRFPYYGCIFLDDGKVFGAIPWDSIFLLDKNGSAMWTREIKTSHTWSLSENGTAVIVIETADVYFRKGFTKVDNIRIINLADGKDLFAWHMEDYLGDIGALFPADKLQNEPFSAGIRHNMLASTELSHINSAVEIPENALAKKYPFFAKGNILVNLHGIPESFIILSSDLKRILWISKNHYYAHDLQIMGDGKLLFFENRRKLLNHRYSSIKKINPVDESVALDFGGNRITSLYSKTRGAVQEIEGGRYYVYAEFLNENYNQVKIIDRNGDVIYSLGQEELKINGYNDTLLRVRVSSLDLFLKNNSF